MIIAHAPLSYLAHQLDRTKRKKKDSLLLIVLSLIFGVLPDFDFFFMLVVHNQSFGHHETIFHTPIFWILLSVLIYYTFKLLNKLEIANFKIDMDLVYEICRVLLISTLIHLLADLLTGQIMILYPFTSQAFTLLTNILPHTSYSILGNPTIFIEIFILTIFTLVILFKYTKADQLIKKFPKAFHIVVSTISCFFLLLIYTSIQITLQTSIPNSYPKDENGFVNYDLDEDRLHDLIDLDSNNDGVENIYELQLLLEHKERYIQLLKDKKIPLDVKDNDSLLGKYDSQRMITSWYYTANIPIEFAVTEYAKENDIDSYSLAFNEYIKNKYAEEVRDMGIFSIKENNIYIWGIYTKKDNIFEFTYISSQKDSVVTSDFQTLRSEYKGDMKYYSTAQNIW